MSTFGETHAATCRCESLHTHPVVGNGPNGGSSWTVNGQAHVLCVGHQVLAIFNSQVVADRVLDLLDEHGLLEVDEVPFARPVVWPAPSGQPLRTEAP